jgi:phenylalanyl-tRNA synthetase beta chain
MRPISNVVDVTNYVLLERCRPLHAFDLGRLAQSGARGLVVRLADEGEHMTTLDGVERTLTANELLICDAERRPQAIAGIMGGRDSEVDDNTTEILLESAYFSPGGISRSSKRLGLRSEASARFERGVDPNGCDAGADRAIELLREAASADAPDTSIDIYPEPVERPRLTVRTARVNAVLGTELDTAAVRALLAPLGIDVEPAAEPDTTVAVCPTWRPDLEREIDLVEEVARRYGLQNITRTVASAPPGTVGRLTPDQRERRLVADVLAGAGYAEALTMPLVAPADLTAVGVSLERAVSLANPLRAEESVLRASLRPALLAAIARNAARGNADVALFEIGTVFEAPSNELLPDERTMVAGLRGGRRRLPPRPDARAVEVADAVDAVEAIATSLRLASVHIVPDSSIPGLHPARAARVEVDGIAVGVVGECDPDELRALGVTDPVVAFELDLDALRNGARTPAIFRPVSTFPPANIDLAFVVATDITAADIAATLRTAAGELVESVRLFDVYRSGDLGADRVSLAFTLRFRAPDRTLTDTEIAELRTACITAVEHTHNATLR